MSIIGTSHGHVGQSPERIECVELSEMGLMRNCRRYRPQIRMLMILCILVTATILVINLYTTSSDADAELRKLTEEGTGMAAWKLRNPRPQRKGNSRKLVLEDIDDEVAIQMCSTPRLSLENDANKDAFYRMPKLECVGPYITYLDKGVIRINRTTLGTQKLKRCEYQPIVWTTDVTYDYADLVTVEQEPFEAKLDYDFIHVKCWLHIPEYDDAVAQKSEEKADDNRAAEIPEDTGAKPGADEGGTNLETDQIPMYGSELEIAADFEQFLIQVVADKEVLTRCKTAKPSPGSTGMNVLMLALDSMSHLSYQRKLPKTYKYLKDKMKAVILNGYNIVGDATTKAIVPIMTGKTELQLPETRRNQLQSNFVDVYPLIWNKFEEKGYATMYAEDSPSLGTFNLRMNGFEQMPTDHYIRPFWQAVWDSNLKAECIGLCVGPTPIHQFTLDYLKGFFTSYKEVPRFAFGFIGELTHADNNPGEYADEDIVKLLSSLMAGGYLDNTLVIVMGDHGARYSKVRQTVQGKLEERLPMMSLTFPYWFTKKYPKLLRNLKTNANRLTTPFDLHETLRDVLNIERISEPVKYSDRGISLLREMPLNRTCGSAGIAPHWCTCMHWKEMDITDPVIVQAAQVVVDEINKQTKVANDRCHRLKLSSIDDARMVLPNEKVLKYTKSLDADQRIANFSENANIDLMYYQVMIQTSPNNAMYEGTVQRDFKTNTYTANKDISRINAYGDQPHCIMDSHIELRKYCYCRTPPTPKPSRAALKHRKQKSKT